MDCERWSVCYGEAPKRALFWWKRAWDKVGPWPQVTIIIHYIAFPWEGGNMGFSTAFLYVIFNMYSNSPWLWHVMTLRCSHFGFKEIERARSLDHVFCSLLLPLGTWIPPISWGPHASSPSYEWYNLDHSVRWKVVQTSSCAHWYGTPRWEFKWVGSDTGFRWIWSSRPGSELSTR